MGNRNFNFVLLSNTTFKSNNYVLEVSNLGNTEAADNADFNALEVPPGGVAKSCPSHPDSLVS